MLPPFVQISPHSLQLSPNEQAALVSAEEEVDQSLMEEQHDATRRLHELDQELSKIIHLAIRNKDNKATLESWAQQFEKMFRDAGKTTFACDTILVRLMEVEDEVREGTQVRFLGFRSFRIYL